MQKTNKEARERQGLQGQETAIKESRKKSRVLQERVLQPQQGKPEILKAVALRQKQKSFVQPSGPGGRDARAGLLKRVGDWPQLVLGCPPVSCRGESNKSVPDSQEAQDHTGKHQGAKPAFWSYNSNLDV